MTIQLIALLVLATVSMLLFYLLNSHDWPERESWIAEHIPFMPMFIVPYLGLFPYIAFSMLALLFFTPVAARLYTSLIFGGVVSALIWYFLPSGVSDRPIVSPDGIFTKTVAWIYRIDPGGAAFPSSHVYTAIICSYYLTFAFPLHEISIWVMGATIVSSTLFVKQHHVSDLIAGAALAAASIGFSYVILGALA